MTVVRMTLRFVGLGVLAVALVGLAPSVALAHPGHGGHGPPLSRTQVGVLVFGALLILVGGVLGWKWVTRGGVSGWVPACLLVVGLIAFGVGPPLVALAYGPCRGRPSGSARLQFVRPREGEVFRTLVPVEVQVVDGRLVSTTATVNRPGEGHLHIFVDGQLISMIGVAIQKVPIPLGRHTISVELVANDHGSFCPALSAARSVEVVR